MSMDFKRKLPIPLDIKQRFPLNAAMAIQKQKNDDAIRAIFTGESKKLLLIIGPCSADSKEAVLEYLGRLRILQDKISDKVVIVPRVFTNKPRTTGFGYKGMLHQPDPNENPDMLRGIIATRELHMCALKDHGFSCADEMLYPDNIRYLSDLLSYVSVGARSVENQQHRLTASGLDQPVGMKNPMDGDLNVMLNSVCTAQSAQTFIYRGWEVESSGNPLAHAILRGSVSKTGEHIPNYSYDDIMKLLELYSRHDIKEPSCVVDCSHSNCGKDAFRQRDVALSVVESRKSAALSGFVKGIMIESYLLDGSCDVTENVYGKSITDPCLGWEKTEKLVLEIADKI